MGNTIVLAIEADRQAVVRSRVRLDLGGVQREDVVGDGLSLLVLEVHVLDGLVAPLLQGSRSGQGEPSMPSEL